MNYPKLGTCSEKTLVSISWKNSADADVRGALNNLTGNHNGWSIKRWGNQKAREQLLKMVFITQRRFIGI